MRREEAPPGHVVRYNACEKLAQDGQRRVCAGRLSDDDDIHIPFSVRRNPEAECVPFVRSVGRMFRVKVHWPGSGSTLMGVALTAPGIGASPRAVPVGEPSLLRLSEVGGLASKKRPPATANTEIQLSCEKIKKS